MKVGPDTDPEVREPCFPRAQKGIPEPFPFSDTQETVESLVAKSGTLRHKFQKQRPDEYKLGLGLHSLT